MKIAFVGKGGSGKSTITSLFLLYLIKNKKKFVCVDADLNIHIPKILGFNFPEDKFLSNQDNTFKIREFLMGKSQKIKSVKHIYKTTPPSKGVNLFEIENNNFIISNFFIEFYNGYFSAVGTYQNEGIGMSCYHVNLSILENLLTFSNNNKDDWFLCDMVAGIDAFANTMFIQFDLLVLIIEPTIESIEVYNQYVKLAKIAGVDNRIYVLYNKIEVNEDLLFLNKNIDSKKLIGSISNNKKIKYLRRENQKLTEDILDKSLISTFEKLDEKAKKWFLDQNKRLKLIHKLHLKYVSQPYVKNAVGDISDQIDENFRFD